MIKSLASMGTLGPTYLTQESDFFGKPLSKPSSESGCSADDCMRFLGDGEALCLPDSSCASPAEDSLPVQNKVLSKQNRLLWEENQKLASELAKLRAQNKAQIEEEEILGQDKSLQNHHPLIYQLLEKEKSQKRPFNPSEAIGSLARGSREHVLSLGPHGIRHAAVQILLFTFALREDIQNYPEQPLRLVFTQAGPDTARFKRAQRWVAPLRILDSDFQEKAQALVDKHLKFDLSVERPSDYDCTILSQAMMRYPEIKDTCLFESDVVEKQSNPLGQLTSCIF